MEMKRIYVCSPLGEQLKEDLKTAEAYAAFVMKKGELPVWPLSLLTLTDGESNEARALIRLSGKNLLWLCDEIWVFGEVTPEMEEELHFAKQMNLPVKKILAEEVKKFKEKLKKEKRK